MELRLRPQDEFVKIVLKKLLPYLETKVTRVVGSVATVYNLETRNGLKRSRVIGDLNFIHWSIGLPVSPSVQNDFVVAHYHRDIPNIFGSVDPPYLQLFDPVSGFEVNVFGTTQIWTPDQYEEAEFLGFNLWMIKPEAQLVGLVHGLQRVDQGELLQPKHLEDCDLLMEVADKILAGRIWTKVGYREKFDGKTMRQAIAHAKEVVDQRPELLDDFPFKRGRDEICENCQNSRSPEWPLASPEEVYDRFLAEKWGLKEDLL